MKSLIFWISTLLALAIAGCGITPDQPIITPNVIRITSASGSSKPYIYHWNIGDISLVNLDGVSLGIVGIQLTGSQTRAFYSLSGKSTVDFFDEYKIELIDNLGQIINQENIVPLGKIENFELGIINFHRRNAYATELYLHIQDKTNPASEYKILLARFDGPASEDRIDSVFSYSNESGIQQEGYRVVLHWMLDSEQKLSGNSPEPGSVSTSSPKTPTKEPRSPWIELPLEDKVVFEVAFSVQNLESKEVEYLDVQLLSSGNALGSLNGIVTVPTPILAATPAPYPLPYP